MSERITVGGIQVDEVLYDFVNTQAIPGTGVDPDAFWAGASEIFADLGPRNRELLAVLRGFAGLDLVGADVVEVSPAYDHAQMTGIAASHVVYELLSAMAARG